MEARVLPHPLDFGIAHESTPCPLLPLKGAGGVIPLTKNGAALGTLVTSLAPGEVLGTLVTSPEPPEHGRRLDNTSPLPHFPRGCLVFRIVPYVFSRSERISARKLCQVVPGIGPSVPGCASRAKLLGTVQMGVRLGSIHKPCAKFPNSV